MKKNLSRYIFLASMIIIIIMDFILANPVFAAWQNICSDNFIFTGTWTQTGASICNHNNYTSATGNSFSVGATTTRFKIIGQSCVTCGILDIYLNGRQVAKMDTWASTTHDGAILFDSGLLPYDYYLLVGIVEARINFSWPTPTSASISITYYTYDDSTPTPTITPIPSLTSTITSTPTITLTPAVKPTNTPLPTLYFSSNISYGDYAIAIPLICLVMLGLIGFITWLVIKVLGRSR